MSAAQLLVFGAATIAAHHDNPWHKFANDFDKVGLRCHYIVNVLVCTGNFIQSAGKQTGGSAFASFSSAVLGKADVN